MAAVLDVQQTAGKELFITFMTFAHSHLDSTFSATKKDEGLRLCNGLEITDRGKERSKKCCFERWPAK